MISLRPIALILMIAVGSHAIAGEPGPDLPPDRPAAVAEPTAKVVSTSRKKGRGERSATPVLETFPPTDDLQEGQPAGAPEWCW